MCQSHKTESRNFGVIFRKMRILQSWPFCLPTVKMSLYCWLALVALVPMTLSTEPGVKVRVTAKGLEYGKHCSTSFLCQLKNDNALSSVSSSDCLAFRYRQTSGNGGTPRETQSHPDPWFFRETEGVSHRQGQVQPNKVSHQIIQHCTFWKKNWDRGKTKSLYKLARCVFQSHYQECWIANIVSESGGRDGCQDVHYWCLYQCAWKLEGQVPLYVSEKDFSIDAFKCIVWKLCCSSDVSLDRRDSGSFDLDVRDLSISATIAIGRDATGHPTVSGANCAANVGSARVKFHGGAR